jgi:hypothetical protein
MNSDRHPSDWSADRRKDRRFTVSWPVEFSLFGSAKITGQPAVVIDLSFEGLCLKTDSPLKAGMILCIRILKLDCETECKEERCLARMLSIAEVKWCREIKGTKEGCYLAGIKHVIGEYS